VTFGKIMIVIHTVVAILNLVASLPLLLGIFCGYKYRNCRETSGRLIGVLLLASVASLVGLFSLPAGFWFPMKSINVLLLLGVVATSVVGLTFWIRRFRFVSLVWLIPGIAMAELAILVVVDNRFRIVVQNTEGVAIDVQDDEMALGYSWSSFGASGLSIRKGSKLGKGEYYFGLLVWLQHKDEWMFCGMFSDLNGNYLGNLEWKSAKWAEWPKHVIVNQNVKE
jgi:hypothetical protein